MAKCVCLMLLLGSLSWAQTVEGSVFDAATGVAAAGVKVELLRSTTPFYETTTDGGGRFRFDNVREEDYSVRYQSPAYWLTAGPTDYRPFHVGGETPVKLEARLMPWSKISGRVVDDQGIGVPKAALELTGSGMTINGRTYLRTSWGGGGGAQLSDAPLAMVLQGTTDAEGRFEVQVMPGAYGLSVTAPPGLKPPPTEPDGPALAWKRTWYPGVPSAEGASKIVVAPGGEARDILLKLLAAPAHAVRGIVLKPDGTTAGKAQVTIGEAFRSDSVQTKPNGTFAFPALTEGEWRITADLQAGTVKSSATEWIAVRLRATEWIEVGSHDLENVKLRLLPSVSLRGKVVLEGHEASSGNLPDRPLTLGVSGGRARHDDDLGFLLGGPINWNGKGEIVQEVFPGTYHLGPQLQPPAPPYYLHAVRIGGADLLRQDVEISSDSTITVVFNSDGGIVRGTAENCASGGVLLVPQEPTLRRRGFSRAGPCDPNGRYEVRAIRPGDYYALALAGNGPVPAIEESLLQQGAKVAVRAGEATALDLKAVTKPVF